MAQQPGRGAMHLLTEARCTAGQDVAYALTGKKSATGSGLKGKSWACMKCIATKVGKAKRFRCCDWSRQQSS